MPQKTPKWLSAVAEREAERAEALACDLPEVCPTRFPELYTHFYPELTSHLGSHANFAFSGPVWVDLLRYPTLCLPIHPVKPQDFRPRYGVTVDELTEFVERGFVIPIIDCDIHRYHSHRSYLRPLLEHPNTISSAIRGHIAWQHLVPDYEDLFGQATEMDSAIGSCFIDICRDVELTYPQDLSFKQLLALLSDGTREAIKELLSALRAKIGDANGCRVAELENSLYSAWSEAAAKARRLAKGQQTGRKFIGGLFGIEAVAGELLLGKALQLLIGKKRFSRLKKRINDLINDVLVKGDRVVQNRQVIAAFDFIETINQCP